jgi:hypothetical protein
MLEEVHHLLEGRVVEGKGMEKMEEVVSNMNYSSMDHHTAHLD